MSHLDFGAPDFALVAPGLDFVVQGLDFVAPVLGMAPASLPSVTSRGHRY
jgi:hypothetical protein